MSMAFAETAGLLLAPAAALSVLLIIPICNLGRRFDCVPIERCEYQLPPSHLEKLEDSGVELASSV